MFPWLAEPNLVFGLLLAALLLSVLAVLAPGTGLLELLATGLWMVAVLGMMGLEIRWWAVLLLVAAVVPLVVYMRLRKRVWLATVIGMLLLGALLLIRPTRGAWLAVHPLWALVGSALFALLLWEGALKMREALDRPQVLDLTRLVGQVGVTRTPVHHEGTVYVAGELWSARSTRPLPKGIRVRVVRREGLLLWVEPLEEP